LALPSGLASGPTVFAWVPTPASGPTVLAFAPVVALGPTVFAWVPGPTLEPAGRMFGPTCPVLGTGPTLGDIVAFGAILAFGPTGPIERAAPRCAKHMPVSKPNNMPPRITFFILSSTISVPTCGQSSGKLLIYVLLRSSRSFAPLTVEQQICHERLQENTRVRRMEKTRAGNFYQGWEKLAKVIRKGQKSGQDAIQATRRAVLHPSRYETSGLQNP
jgi:hypothetical protein